MGKNTKTVFRAFDYLHCDDFAKFLMEMAAKGWHFKEWGVGLKFEKGESEQTVYAVEVFTAASEYDLRPEPHTEEFAEYCTVAGWELVDAKRKFCIFKRVREDATPILTQEERVENAFAERKKELFMPFLLALMFLTTQLLDYSTDDIYSYVNQIFSSFELGMTLLWGMFFLYRAGCMVSWFIKKNKIKRKLAKGEEIYIGNGKSKCIIDWGIGFIVIIALLELVIVPTEWTLRIGVFTGATIAAMLFVSILLAKFRPDSDTNYVIQTVLAMCYVIAVFLFAICWAVEDSETTVADAPVVRADYMEYTPEIEQIDRLVDSNILGSKEIYIIDYTYVDEKTGQMLMYEKYSSRIEWLIEHIWELRIGEVDRTKVTDCTQEWGAEYAFGSEGYYVVRYENTIFIYSDYDDRTLTQEQIDIIREKMDLR